MDLTLWRNIFKISVLRATSQRHYWVIDELDECPDAAPLFESMLGKTNLTISRKAFITSRDTLDSGRVDLGIDSSIHVERVYISDKLKDIELYAEQKTKKMLVANEASRNSLVKIIIEKSSGSFLWSVLLLK